VTVRALVDYLLNIRVIINILFYLSTKQSKAKSQITNYKLLINSESAVYRLKCRKEEKVEWELVVTRYYYQQDFIIIFGRLRHSWVALNSLSYCKCAEL